MNAGLTTAQQQCQTYHHTVYSKRGLLIIIMLSIWIHLTKLFLICCLNCPVVMKWPLRQRGLYEVHDSRRVSFYLVRAGLKYKMTEHLLSSSTCLLPLRGTKRGHLIHVGVEGGGRRGWTQPASRPGSHSNVRARDSGDTWSHLSAVYTFLSWSLSYRGDHLSYSKKESKQAGEVEGWMDGGRERKEARAVCVNAGWDCKASWAMTAKCANFLLGLETLSHREGSATELWHRGTFFFFFFFKDLSHPVAC